MPAAHGIYRGPLPGHLPEHAVIALPRKEYVPRVLEDRWYQTQALEEIDRRFTKGGARANDKGEILVCPTGGGKTSVASRAIGKWLNCGERVLILVDLERLLDQMQEDLEEEGIYPLIEKAEHSALKDFNVHGHCVLASMQTLHPKRLAKWAKDAFDKIVIDECHEIRWRSVVDYFKTAQFLGLTATPVRADGQSLKKWFNYPYIKTLSMWEAIEGWNPLTGEYEKPFLSRIVLETIPAKEIDLRNIRMVGKDFDKNELDREIWKHTNFIASSIIERAGDRPTWVYCPRIHSCEAIAEAMRDMGAAAAPYSSKTEDPRAVLKRFERGDLQYLTSVSMLIKGVNVRKVACIALAQPQPSLGPLIQRIGRGTRLSPETDKKDCLILEFDCTTRDDQRIMSVIDAILHGVDEDEKKKTKAEKEQQARLRERTDQLVKTKAEMDVIKAAKLAKEQLSQEDADERTRKLREKMLARRAKYERVAVPTQVFRYDPFAGLDKQATLGEMAASRRPAEPAQIQRIVEMTGFAPPPNLSFDAAEKHIQDRENRQRYNYATDKQIRLLVEGLGVEPGKAGRMKKWDAGKFIDGQRLAMMNELSTTYEYQQETLGEMKIWELINFYRVITNGQ